MRIVSLLLLIAGGCAVIGGSPEVSVTKERSCESDDELAVLGGIMRDFGRALEKRAFGRAKQILQDAKKCVSKASEAMRSHPEFEDVELAVQGADARLEEVIERDRLERVNAAIADLEKRAQRLVDRASVIVAELDSRMPTQQDLGYLDEILAGLASLSEEGQAHQGEKRYQEHAAVRDSFAATLAARRKQAVWQGSLSRALSGPVADFVDAVVEAKAATSRRQQTSAMERARNASSACLAELAAIESNETFDASRLVATKLGILSVADTKRRCSATRNDAKKAAQNDSIDPMGLTAADSRVHAATPRRRKARRRKRKKNKKRRRLRRH